MNARVGKRYLWSLWSVLNNINYLNEGIVAAGVVGKAQHRVNFANWIIGTAMYDKVSSNVGNSLIDYVVRR